MAMKEIELRLLAKNRLSGNYWEFRFEKPLGFNYSAGQYLSIKVNEEGERRSYSMASCNKEKEVVLVADVSPMGVGSKYLLSLNEGDVVSCLPAMGNFVLKRGVADVMLLATGSGVVPMRSMLADLVMRKYEGRVRLLWGMRKAEDLFWLDEFNKWKSVINFDYEVWLSRDEVSEHENGHIQDGIKKMKDVVDFDCYVCCNGEMIDQVSELLASLGVGEDRIYYEKFY
jgi:ferredoxin-NADP reductase